MKKNNILFLLSLLALSLSAVGCSGNTNAGNTETAAASSNTAAVSSDEVKEVEYAEPEANVPDNEYNEYINSLPGVTASMTNAEFWLDDDSDVILRTPAEIEAFNEELYNTEGTDMCDLTSISETFDDYAYREELSDFEYPVGLYVSGNAVGKDYFDAIKYNILSQERMQSHENNDDSEDNNESDEELSTVSYGIITQRTLMKELPYSDILSDTPGDPEYDEYCATALHVNEPAVVYIWSEDGNYCYVQAQYYSGWIPSADIAICKSRDEWMSAWNFQNFLVVTASEFRLEESNNNPVAATLMLDMGTRLELSDNTGMVDDRYGYYNYRVYIPYRDEDGYYAKREALVPINREVSVGYLPLTERNILTQAYKCLGNRYGWGGMLDSQDCSAFTREVYACFGYNLPRNTGSQTASTMEKYDLSGLSANEKYSILDNAHAGSLLFIPGHTMMYLGKFNGEYYTINACGILGAANGNGEIVGTRVRTVIINSLSSSYRSDGSVWTDALTYVMVP